MASEMYKLITREVQEPGEEFANSLRTQGGALSETKSRREHNVKRVLCVGGSLAAVVVLMVLMTSTGSPASIIQMASSACRGLYVEHKRKDYVDSNADVGKGVVAEHVDDCLRKCDDRARCNAVSFYSKAMGANGENCYPKELEIPCLLPEDDDESFRSDAEEATLYLKCDYHRVPGKDYIPSTSSSGPSENQVKVEDLDDGKGKSVEGVAECEAECDGNPHCNTASFYLSEKANGSNCFLKRMEMSSVPCGNVPEDAQEDADAILVMKCDGSSGCTGSAVIVPGGGDEVEEQ